MIPTGPFWMICYRGHQIYRTGFERIDNQGCREAALNFWRYSLLCVYHVSVQTTQIYAEMSQDSVDRKLKEWNDTWFSSNVEVKEVKKSIPGFLKRK